jgi:general secretion pathway protein D
MSAYFTCTYTFAEIDGSKEIGVNNSENQPPKDDECDPSANKTEANYDGLDWANREFILIKARSLCFNSEYGEAFRLVNFILGYEPNNRDALFLKNLITKKIQASNGVKQRHIIESKTHMIDEVNRAWGMPKIVDENGPISPGEIYEEEDVIKKLSTIVIPKISFNKTPLSQAVETITEMSELYDKDGNENHRGINIVLIKSNDIDPNITLSLKTLSLDKILNFVAKSSGFQMDLEDNTIVLSQIGTPKLNNLETKFFTLSRSSVVRMTGLQDDHVDFAEKPDAKPIKPENKKDKKSGSKTMARKKTTSSPKPTLIAEEERLIKQFLQHAGVNFAGTEGSDMAYDGTQLIVTQTSRNIKRVAEILRKYDAVKQVEIETKFLEVQQNVLDELHFKWDVSFGNPSKNKYFRTAGKDNKERDALRSLGGTFGLQDSTSGDGSIVQKIIDPSTGTTHLEKIDIANVMPSPPSGINLGANIGPIGAITGVYNYAKVNLLIKALEQQSGSDLMSAPKLTVLSGKTAKITVAQEFIYPRTYGAITSDVGSTTSTSGTGAAGVTITAGTPSDFITRNLGVEMSVTPVVEENNCISLRLEPRVTEFERFIEYGGRSIAISGDTTVNIPSGFLQPIFSTREIKTEVTIFDGATVVMGGLTREEVKEVHDKIPILGDIPLVGKLFRSKGETSQKKNLLIFVTANILSPGGVPLRHARAKNNRTRIYRNKPKESESTR